MLYAIIVVLLLSTLIFAGIYLAERRRFRRHLADTELHQLRAQLTPHFLFNTLNAIAELGYGDPAAADQAITQLSGLLRKSLDASHGQEISLKAEIDFLENYLALQRMLMRDTLDIAVTVEPRALHARVPAMILQPLAENALIHGLNRDAASRISITASLATDVLAIEVRDNGPGLTMRGSDDGRCGIGIANTQARLQRLYGAASGVVLENCADGGTVARVTLPFREAP